MRREEKGMCAQMNKAKKKKKKKKKIAMVPMNIIMPLDYPDPLLR